MVSTAESLDKVTRVNVHLPYTTIIMPWCASASEVTVVSLCVFLCRVLQCSRINAVEEELLLASSHVFLDFNLGFAKYALFSTYGTLPLQTLQTPV